MTHAARLLLVAILVLPAFAASTAFEPAELPPEMPWRGPSEALIVAADDPWITPGEASGLTRSPSYDETMAWIERLAAASPQVSMVSLGRSPEGRDVWLVVASKEGAATPEALRASGRPTLLAQAGIHSGEIDGKDAGMMLLRDMTVSGRKTELLDGANVLFVPIFNVDGHERASRFSRMNQRGPEVMGWRTTARNLNLNRDYAKLDTPEMQAMVAALVAWPVDLYLDLHVTDGADYQYDITYGWTGRHGHSPRIATWLDEVLRPALDRDLERMGHVPGPLIFQVDRFDPRKGIWDWTSGPRFSSGYGDARHLPSVLVENHSLKSFRRRVLGTYVLLEGCLRALAENGSELQAAVAADAARRRESVPLSWTQTPGEPPRMSYKAIAAETQLSEVSGSRMLSYTAEPVEIEVPMVPITSPAVSVSRPAAYWIPPAWPEVIERLRIHGIELEILQAPRTAAVTAYRLVGAELEPEPYEGHARVRVPVPKTERRTMTYPAGSARVSTDQPLGDLAILLLEPQSPDSFLQWGFFLEVMNRVEYAEGYMLEPLARRMMAENRELRAEFERRLESDEAFRGDPRARLTFFYERTPYYDERYLLYPVTREERQAENE